jgi:hypothetical protein
MLTPSHAKRPDQQSLPVALAAAQLRAVTGGNAIHFSPVATVIAMNHSTAFNEQILSHVFQR